MLPLPPTLRRAAAVVGVLLPLACFVFVACWRAGNLWKWLLLIVAAGSFVFALNRAFHGMQLVEAMSDHNSSKLRSALAAGASPNTRLLDEGRPIILWAAEEPCEKEFLILLRAGAATTPLLTEEVATTLLIGEVATSLNRAIRECYGAEVASAWKEANSPGGIARQAAVRLFDLLPSLLSAAILTFVLRQRKRRPEPANTD
jgi:hypothetical protein